MIEFGHAGTVRDNHFGDKRSSCRLQSRRVVRIVDLVDRPLLVCVPPERVNCPSDEFDLVTSMQDSSTPDWLFVASGSG